MPDNKPIPKMFQHIANAVDTGAPMYKLVQVYGYKEDVLRKIHGYVKEGKNSDDPAVTALIEKWTPKQQAGNYKYAIDGRDKWAEMADYPVVSDNNTPMKQLIKDVSGKYGIKPEILYSSAMEEGLNQTVKNGKFDTGGKVSGFDHLGLDDLEEQGINVKYEPTLRKNEKGRTVKSGNFANMRDALDAKAQVFTNFRGKVASKLKAEGVNFDNDDAVDFLTMQAYNGGMGVLDKYLKKYKDEGLMENAAFLNKDPSGEYADNQTYIHSRRRYDPAKMMRDKKTFD